MEAGQLRQIITIKRPPAGAAAGLSRDMTGWETVCTCHAAVKPIRGKELWEAQQAQSLIDHRITLRMPKAAVTTACRVVYKGRVFAIQYKMDPDERGRWLVLMCTELED